jgi:hypothetical protein
MTMQGEQLDQIVLAVEYNPREDDPKARMLELFLRTTPAMELTSAEEGAAMTDAGKSLSINSDTGNAWTETSRGIYRFVAYTMSNTTDFSPGRLLTLTFTTLANIKGTTVEFAFQKQSQTFAPEEADLLLQLSPYDTPVQVVVQ